MHAITPALRSLSSQPSKSSSNTPSQPRGDSSCTLRCIGSHGFGCGFGFGSWSASPSSDSSGGSPAFAAPGFLRLAALNTLFSSTASALLRSSPPRSRPRQKYPAKVHGQAKYKDQRNAQKLAFAQRQKAHEERPTGGRQATRMHQASASRRDANERRTTNRQQAEEVARQHNHDRGCRVELCRAQPSAEMQLMPHDVTPFIVPQRISSAAPGGFWPRACGDHLER